MLVQMSSVRLNESHTSSSSSFTFLLFRCVQKCLWWLVYELIVGKEVGKGKHLNCSYLRRGNLCDKIRFMLVKETLPKVDFKRDYTG